MRQVLSIATFLILTQLLEARIGETIKECNLRYGSPIFSMNKQELRALGYTVVDESATYNIGNIKVEFYFWNKKACFARYTKSDGSSFTNNQSSEIFHAESQGKSWKEIPTIYLQKYFYYANVVERTDHKVVAGLLLNPAITIDFYTKDYITAREKESEAKTDGL
jgi:hypothetical protein